LLLLESGVVCSYILSQAGLPVAWLLHLLILAVTCVRHSDTSLIDQGITMLKHNSRLILAVVFVTASVISGWLLTIAIVSMAWLLLLLTTLNTIMMEQEAFGYSVNMLRNYIDIT
jgi:hypothetical protein